jgi:peptidoglycan hydrolase-like protein with peptidoglycan-binding domain
MRLLKKGDTGNDVKTLQQKLMISPDGVFGPKTEKHVIRFQLSHSLASDGIVGSDTWAILLQKGPQVTEDIDEDTDSSKQYFNTPFNQIIHKHYLPEGEYLKGPIKNEYVFLHHTAGNDNPYRCIDHWGRDSRGRVATEFVLGGINHRNGNDDYNGVMVQAFPEGCQGWHLGRTASGYMNRHSVGLEICNMGYLDNNNRTYVKSLCQREQVIGLQEAFKGKLLWHAYSEKQIKETEKWIKFVAERDQIDIRLGLKQYIKKYGPSKGFDFQEDAYYGKVKGLLTHGNVRSGKSDIYPHPDMVDMIMSL